MVGGPSLARGRERSPPSPTRAERLANALSYFLNPLVFPPVAFSLVSWHFGAPAAEALWVLGVSLAFFCVVPLLALLWMVRAGRAATIEIRDRTGRRTPLLVTVGSYVVGIVLLGATTSTADDGPCGLRADLSAQHAAC